MRDNCSLVNTYKKMLYHMMFNMLLSLSNLDNELKLHLNDFTCKL